MAHINSNDKNIITVDTILSITSTIELPLFPKDETDSHLFYKRIFDKIANFLMCNTRLHLPTERTYKFLEIEFYLKDVTNNHDDPYSHGHEHQLTCGEWYFHHVGKNRNSYRGGSRKGIDITFGSAERNIYGGILIRAIQDELTKEIIEGPSLIVDKILEACGASQKGGIREMVENLWEGKSGIFRNTGNSNGLVYLLQINDELTNVEVDDTYEKDEKGKKRVRNSTGLTSPYFDQKSRKRSRLMKDKIYTSPRVGITLSNEKPSTSLRLQYILKPYRYFTSPHLIKKGKVQLIIGLYDHFKEINKVAEIADISRSLVERYIQEMANGTKDGDLNDFIGKKGRILNAIEYCKMVGVVNRILAETMGS